MSYVSQIENDPTIPEEEKARLYPGTYDLILAELRSRDVIDFFPPPDPDEEEAAMRRQNVNYYYNPEADSENIDGLLHLCRPCHDKHYPEAPWAQVGDDDMFCEICRTQNNPHNPLLTGEIGGYYEISNRFEITSRGC